MVIAGAKGLAKELLEIMAEQNALNDLYFFDNVSPEREERLLSQFPVLHSFDEVLKVFRDTGDAAFALGLGGPALRHKMFAAFSGLGGRLVSVISPRAHVGKFGMDIQAGCCILPGAVITSHVAMGKACLVNPNATISHDSALGDFVEVSPGVNVTGNCIVGDFCFLGSNSVILPKVKLGRNVVVGAGAVVTKDVPDNSMVVGVPAVIRKKLAPIDI
jgi:sugar O-acyltransferase (sialic acid O-acetyltransferase NeuD family)